MGRLLWAFSCLFASCTAVPLPRAVPHTSLHAANGGGDRMQPARVSVEVDAEAHPKLISLMTVNASALQNATGGAPRAAELVVATAASQARAGAAAQGVSGAVVVVFVGVPVIAFILMSLTTQPQSRGVSFAGDPPEMGVASTRDIKLPPGRDRTFTRDIHAPPSSEQLSVSRASVPKKQRGEAVPSQLAVAQTGKDAPPMKLMDSLCPELIARSANGAGLNITGELRSEPQEEEVKFGTDSMTLQVLMSERGRHCGILMQIFRGRLVAFLDTTDAQQARTIKVCFPEGNRNPFATVRPLSAQKFVMECDVSGEVMLLLTRPSAHCMDICDPSGMLLANLTAGAGASSLHVANGVDAALIVCGVVSAIKLS